MDMCLLFSKICIYQTQSFTTCFFSLKMCLRHAFMSYTLIHFIPFKHYIIFHFIFTSYFNHFSINGLLAQLCAIFNVLLHNKSMVILICICLLLKGKSHLIVNLQTDVIIILFRMQNLKCYILKYSVSNQRRLNYTGYS